MEGSCSQGNLNIYLCLCPSLSSSVATNSFYNHKDVELTIYLFVFLILSTQ